MKTTLNHYSLLIQRIYEKNEIIEEKFTLVNVASIFEARELIRKEFKELYFAIGRESVKNGIFSLRRYLKSNDGGGMPKEVIWTLNQDKLEIL